MIFAQRFPSTHRIFFVDVGVRLVEMSKLVSE